MKINPTELNKLPNVKLSGLGTASSGACFYESCKVSLFTMSGIHISHSEHNHIILFLSPSFSLLKGEVFICFGLNIGGWRMQSVERRRGRFEKR